LSPISRSGSSSRKLPASASSTSRHSAGEALSTETASGRLLPAAIGMIFVPLPRRVGPTAKPPFSRSRRLHPRTLLQDSAAPFPEGAGPAPVTRLPICRCAPTVGIDGGRSGMGDTVPVVPSIARPCPKPTAHRSARHACLATDVRDYPPVATAAVPLPPSPIVRR
jgi:hypothetical protein